MFSPSLRAIRNIIRFPVCFGSDMFNGQAGLSVAEMGLALSKQDRRGALAETYYLCSIFPKSNQGFLCNRE